MSGVLSALLSDNPTKGTVYTALALGATLGILLPESRALLSWFRLHFLHRSKLHIYHHLPVSASEATHEQNGVDIKDNGPWALVTGASDGIGYGFVQELAAAEFNVILHGRNQEKVDGLIEGLQKQWPDRSYKSFICNATDRDLWGEKLDLLVNWLGQHDCNLTVLINNIGGNPNMSRSFTPLVGYSAAEVTALVDMNATFPAQVTRALLPILQRNKPSLILNMSSAAGTDLVTLPYLVGYSASKAFNRQFSKALRLEMAATGHQEVEVLSMIAGKVQSGGMKTETSWIVPNSRKFARSALQKVGCGRSEVLGWWSHSLQAWTMGLLPEWAREKILVNIGGAEKKRLEEEWKKGG